MPTVRVQLAPRSYDVHIGPGLLKTLPQRLARLLPKHPRLFVVTSPEIWALWHKKFLAPFKQSKFTAPTVLFLPAGERHKRLTSLDSLCEQLARTGADRDSVIMALGGGVIGDVAGFLAAIYMRGIRYIQVPTTLLAQVDSSVGGKTGVNLAAGKNLVGSFHHPLAVFADTDLLATLPPAELRAGLQESIKAGIIRDPKLFSYLEKNAAKVLAGNPAALAHVVTASVRVKADVVSRDEKESGLRMILNFGHTLGHAIEAATGYKQLLHGQAIALGSIAALVVAAHRGTVTNAEAHRMADLIVRYGPLPAFRADAKKLVALTTTDKKNRSGVRSFILPRGIGDAVIVRDITDAELLHAVNVMKTIHARSLNK